MTNIVLEGPIAILREQEVKLLFDLAELVGKFGDETQNDRERLLQNANDLRDMFFLVVIVGEFNAGKSTFVNALLGDTLLPTGITPTTDVIEMVRYSPQPKPPIMKENDALREWGHPNTGAPGVVIVDTPGTGSVFAKHERIAKNFLSRSDLVLFLLSAKRAFAQTEKLYLEMARDYGKKIILVINQIDLLEKKEQKEVISFVKQQVSELLNLEPPIFTISAKKAFQKRSGGIFSSGGAADESGMDVVREYLADIFKRVPPAKQKLLSQMDFADSLLKKYASQVEDRLKLIGTDHAYVEQLNEELEKQASTLAERLSTTMRELDRIFDALLDRGRAFVNTNLTLGKNFFRSPDKDLLRQKFEKEVVANALDQISNLSEDYVSAVVDSSRRYWRSIIDRLNRLEALMKQEISTPDAGSYAEQRAALQEAIAIADSELKSYTDNNIAERLRETFADNLFGFTISLTSVIGGIIAFILSTAASGPLVGAGASALATIGGVIVAPALAIGGGAGALIYGRKLRRDALKELETRLQALRESYRQSLVNLTDRERVRLLQYGQQILAPVFSHLDVIALRYKDQKHQLGELSQNAVSLRNEINKLQITEHAVS